MDLVIGFPTKPKTASDPYNGEAVVALLPVEGEKSKRRITLSYELCKQLDILEGDYFFTKANDTENFRVTDVFLVPVDEKTGSKVNQNIGRRGRTFSNKQTYEFIQQYVVGGSLEPVEETILNVEILRENLPEGIPYLLKLSPREVEIVSEPTEAPEEVRTGNEPFARTHSFVNEADSPSQDLSDLVEIDSDTQKYE